jgi:hypothetical protein
MAFCLTLCAACRAVTEAACAVHHSLPGPRADQSDTRVPKEDGCIIPSREETDCCTNVMARRVRIGANLTWLALKLVPDC